MSFLYEYMTSDELEFAREQAEFENEGLKLEHALTMANMRHEIRLSNIEVDSYVNEYTEDSLTEMYTKEMAIYMEETGNILQRIGEFIKKIFSKIFSRHKELEANDDGDPQKVISLPFDPNAANNILNSIKSILNKFNPIKDGNVDIKTILGDAGIAGTAIGAAVAIKSGKVKELFDPCFKKTDMKSEEAKKSCKDLAKNGEETAKVGMEAAGKIPALSGIISSFTQKIAQKVNELTATIDKVVFHKNTKEEGNEENKDSNNPAPAEGNTENKPAEGNTEAKPSEGDSEAKPAENEDKKDEAGNKKEKFSDVIKNLNIGPAAKNMKAFAVKYKDDLELSNIKGKKDIVLDPAMMTKILNHAKSIKDPDAENWEKLVDYVNKNKDNINFNESTDDDLYYEYNFHAMDEIEDETFNESALDIEEFMSPSSRVDMEELSELVDRL